MTQELYELPEAWEWRSLDSLVSVKGGKRLPNGKKVQDEKTEYPYIRVADFNELGTVDESSVKYITQDIYEAIKNYTITSDDLYISIAGTIGKTGTVPATLSGANLTENAARLIIKDKAVLALRYLYYFTQSQNFINQAGIATKVVAQPKLALTRLKQILIPTPPFDVQRHLVKKLDALLNRIDTAIEHLEHSLELNNQLFASSLNQAFNPLDAEVQPDGTYQLPEGWDWHGIDDVTQIGVKRGFVPDVDENGTVVFISMSDIDQDTGLNSGYERKPFEAVKNGYTKFQKDAVLLAKITPCTENNKTALVTHESGGYATTEVFPIHAKEKLLPHYLLNFLRSSVPRELLISKMEGATGRQRVPTKAVKEIMVPVCSLNEQEKANGFISAMQEKTQSNKQILQQKLEQLQQLKASLLNSVFRGEL